MFFVLIIKIRQTRDSKPGQSFPIENIAPLTKLPCTMTWTLQSIYSHSYTKLERWMLHDSRAGRKSLILSNLWFLSKSHWQSKGKERSWRCISMRPMTVRMDEHIASLNWVTRILFRNDPCKITRFQIEKTVTNRPPIKTMRQISKIDYLILAMQRSTSIDSMLTKPQMEMSTPRSSKTQVITPSRFPSCRPN